MSQIKIPLSKPEILAEDLQAVQQVLLSGTLAMGPAIAHFEEAMTHQCQVPQALAVNNGTSALHLAVQLAGINKNDEVIVSPFSFIASSNVVLYQQAKPIFVDIEEDTLGMNPDLIESAISTKTKAILPTHVFGQSCKIDRIASIAKNFNLQLIEDNCESIGATIEVEGVKKMTGQFGDFATYGFYPNKLITTGEGGMLTIKNAHLLSKAQALRNQGRTSMSGFHLQHDHLGYNYRMSDMQAALGYSQLSRLNMTIQKRTQIASWYQTYFEGFSEIRLPSNPVGFKPAWFVFYIRVDEEKRDHVIKCLYDQGIQSRAYFYPPIHLQPFYQNEFGFKKGDYPVAEKVSSEIIALPFYNQLTKEDVEKVSSEVIKAVRSF